MLCARNSELFTAHWGLVLSAHQCLLLANRLVKAPATVRAMPLRAMARAVNQLTPVLGRAATVLSGVASCTGGLVGFSGFTGVSASSGVASCTGGVVGSSGLTGVSGVSGSGVGSGSGSGVGLGVALWAACSARVALWSRMVIV